MASLFLTNQFKEKVIIAEGGVGIYIRGFALIEDKRNHFASLSDEDRAELTIGKLRNIVNLIDDPSKLQGTDLLYKVWPVSYVPALEYDGTSKIGTYEIHYNASLQYELGKSIKDKTISAIALIGQTVKEGTTYIVPKSKSYLAGFIMLDDEMNLTDNDSYLFSLNVALTPDATLNMTLSDQFDYSSTYTYGNGQDSTTNQMKGSYLIAPEVNKKYSKMPSDVKNLNNFINLLSPEDGLNNVMSTRRPVTIWSTSEDQAPQLMLSVGGIQNGKFVSSEIAFHVTPDEYKIVPTTDRPNIRYDILPGALRVDNTTFEIAHDTTSAFSGRGFSFYSKNLSGGPSVNSVDLFTTAVGFKSASDSFLLDVKNSEFTYAPNNGFNAIKSENINCVSASYDYGTNYIDSRNITSHFTAAPSNANSYYAVDGLTGLAEDVNGTKLNVGEEGHSIVIGPNTNSILQNHNHNIMIGFKGLYGHGKDRYVFGSHNSCWSCSACSGEGYVKKVEKDKDGYDYDTWVACESCSGYGKRTPLFAVGGGVYRGPESDIAYFNKFANHDAKDFINGLLGHRVNLFAAETSGVVENIHYRMSDHVIDKTPFDCYSMRSDFVSVAKQVYEPINGVGYSLKPCYYTKGFIAFPRGEHNEVYRLDYQQIHALKGGAYDAVNQTRNNDLIKGRSRLEAARNHWFKGIKNFVIDIKPNYGKTEFGIRDISAAVYKAYGKQLGNKGHFISTVQPSTIYARNIGKQDAYIKGQAWFKGHDGTIQRYSQRKGLKSGETIRLLYRKGFGYEWEGILNFKYSFHTTDKSYGWVYNIEVQR